MLQILCQEAVDALLWVGTMTKADLAFAAYQLAKSNDNPGPTHWKGARKALQNFGARAIVIICTEVSSRGAPNYQLG